MSEINTSHMLPFIVEPEELAAYLEQNKGEDTLCIVDLSSETNFIQGHIPGAVFLPYPWLMSGQPPAPGKLPSLAQLTKVFEYLGLTKNTHFVVCDDEGGGWAGRFIWTLSLIGHEHYSYLNGGMIAWKHEGFALENGTGQKRKATEIPNLTIDESQLVSLEYIQRGIGNEAFVIWDARSPEEYAGIRVNAAKAGHIPGAINIEWTDLMDPSRAYKVRRDAKEFLLQHGIDGSQEIITHCQSHHRSGFTYVVGKALNYSIRGYDGSWSEWGNHPETPVER